MLDSPTMIMDLSLSPVSSVSFSSSVFVYLFFRLCYLVHAVEDCYDLLIN